MRRPLKEEDEILIDKAVQESKLTGSVLIRLYIKKHYGKTLPNNKIHKYLLKKGISQEDEEKKRQRVYRLYERDHSFSLGHLDWHESKCIPGKQVCVLIDDASRDIIGGDEYNNALEDYNIQIVKEGKKIAWKKYSSLWIQINTDK